MTAAHLALLVGDRREKDVFTTIGSTISNASPLCNNTRGLPHLRFDKRTCKPLTAVADALPAESPVLFLPSQEIGKSNEHLRYPGTLTHSVETLIAMWTEIGACVARSGVRKMVLLNSHGGNISTMDIVSRVLRVRHDMLVFSVSWFGRGMPEGV